MTTSPRLEWPLDLVANEDRNDPPEMITTLDPPLKLWTSALLGQGSVGTVFAGIWGDQRIAVKLFNTVFTYSQQHDLDIEVRGWAVLQNPHVLPYLGKCAVGFGQVALLSPYMENGNLMDFIKKYPAEDRLKLLQQVAEGVRYLHIDALMVHGNLKCANILVSADRTALLCDFGLSTVIKKLEKDDPTRTNVRIRHTAPFSAPELFSDTAMQTSSDTGKLIKRSKTKYSDMYALGMLIYEVITGATPWTGLSSEDIRNEVLVGRRPARTSQFSDDLWNLCQSCWTEDPFARADIADVLASLASAQFIPRRSGVIQALNPSTNSPEADLRRAALGMAL